MAQPPNIDGILITWGDRLFYPGNRIVRSAPLPRLDTMLRRKAAVIRQRIEAPVRRAPQVMLLMPPLPPAQKPATLAFCTVLG